MTMADNDGVTRPSAAGHDPDATDRRILHLLTRNARASYRDIGARVGLSANAAAQRMRRMEQAGVIRGYTAVVDADRDGAVLQAVVHLHTAVDLDLAPLEAQLWAVPGVAEVLDLAGSVDYEVRLRARSQAELSDAVTRIRLLRGITDIETRPVLRVVPRPRR